MEKLFFCTLVIAALAFTSGASAQGAKDKIPTSSGDLEITFIGHGTLVFAFGGKVIHVDPWTQLADYSKLPKADLVLITHEHGDHLDVKAVQAVRTDATKVVSTALVSQKVPGRWS